MDSVGRREIGDGLVDVLDHMGHYHLAGFTRTEDNLVIGTRLMVKPRNVAELADFVEVEVGSEELAES